MGNPIAGGWPRTVLLIALLIPAPGVAQTDPCKVDEALGRCWERVKSESRDDGKDSGREALVRRLTAKTTGVGVAGSGLESAIQDFLPVLAGAVTGGSGEESGEAASFDVNVPLAISFDPTWPIRQTLQLSAVVRDPEVFLPVRDLLGGDAGEAVARLERALEELDDVELRLGWNLEGERFGRDYRSHSDIYSPLLNAVFDRFVRDDDLLRVSMTLSQRFDELVTTGESGCARPTDADASLTDIPARCLNEEGREEVLAPLVAIARTQGELERVVERELKRVGFFQIADLVNNQPQLSLEGGVRLRRGPAGPKETTLNVRYEKGFANINSLVDFCGGRGSVDLDCLERYLAHPGVRRALSGGNRLWASLDFRHVGDHDFLLPGGVPGELSDTWELGGSAGFGRYVAADETGTETGRFDLSVSFIYADDKAQRENRATVTAAYTQRVTAGLSVVAGVRYLSDPEFVDVSDERFQVNFGVRYGVAPEPE